MDWQTANGGKCLFCCFLANGWVNTIVGLLTLGVLLIPIFFSYFTRREWISTVRVEYEFGFLTAWAILIQILWCGVSPIGES